MSVIFIYVYFPYPWEAEDVVGRTYGVMLDDHAIQQSADGVETADVQTCELGNSVRDNLHITNHRRRIRLAGNESGEPTSSGES